MLRNVQEAKFTQILLPIAAKALEPSQREKVGFEPFFTHIMAHELMHGLGPHNVMVGGKKTTVRQQMKELGSALEEAKADVSGLFMLQYLIDHGIVEKSVEEPLYVTFLASTFRTLRFGSQEAHGKGMVLQFNYITDEGGFVYDTARGTFSVDYTRVKGAVRKLTAEIMTIQAEGDYQKAKALLDKYSTVRPNVQKFLDSLTGIPVDIEPRFPLVD